MAGGGRRAASALDFVLLCGWRRLFGGEIVDSTKHSLTPYTWQRFGGRLLQILTRGEEFWREIELAKVYVGTYMFCTSSSCRVSRSSRSFTAIDATFLSIISSVPTPSPSNNHLYHEDSTLNPLPRRRPTGPLNDGLFVVFVFCRFSSWVGVGVYIGVLRH